MEHKKMTQVITRDGFVDDIWRNMDVPLLSDYTGGRAVLLPVDVAPADLASYLRRLDLIVIPFEQSADGRGFSLAAALRALGFKGHIRARGHILVDQFRAAMRCGITDIEISDNQAKRNPQHQWVSVPFCDGYKARLFA
jgi:uncharacterized protein (DUF934 family)